MKGREIAFLILLVTAGIIFHYARTEKGVFSFDWDWDTFEIGKDFTYEESAILNPPLPSHLEIQNSHGDIDIRSSDRNDISLTFRKNIRRKNEEDARQISDKLKPVITRSGDRITIGVNREDFRKTNFETSFVLIVPRNMDVTVLNSHGTIRTKGLRNCSLTNPHGQVLAADISGDLRVSNSHEDIEIENVGSSCTIEGRHADVLIRAIGGILKIDHGFGKVDVEGVSGEAVISGEHSEIFGRKIKGPLEVKTSYEDIVLSDVGPTTVRGHHSAVKASRVAGDLKIITSYEPVGLTDIRGSLFVDGKSTEIIGRSITAGEIQISSSYEDVELYGFSGKTTLHLSHGDAVLEPSSLDFPVEVRNTYSAIRFYWPKGERGSLEAQSHGGEIKWDLVDPPSINKTNGEAVAKANLERTGKPSVLLITTYGDIVLEEGRRRD